MFDRVLYMLAKSIYQNEQNPTFFLKDFCKYNSSDIFEVYSHLLQKHLCHENAFI